MWNGTVSQANSFISVTGITYPLLMNAGAAGVGAAYSCSYDVFFVVGGDGVITYRASGWNDAAVRTAIDDALAALSTDAGDLPASRSFELQAARPNPFNPSTTLAYSLRGDGTHNVQLNIRDLRGRLVRSLVNATQAGDREYSVRWDGRADDGRPATSGSYIAELRVDGASESRFLSLVK